MGKRRSNRDLDAELEKRLERTLDESAKYESAANDAFDKLARRDKVDSAVGEAPSVANEDEQSKVEVDNLAAAHIAEEQPPSILARVAFRDGGYFEFRAHAADGEIGMAYIGEDDGRWAAATGDLASPLRLFCSLTSPDVPVPWLLAAVDRQPDRTALVGDRQLCDEIAETLAVEGDILRLRVPGLARGGGWWVPDSLGIGGYCGINGEAEWNQDICFQLWPAPTEIFEPIRKCTSALSVDLTHKSTVLGKWKMRKTSNAFAAACSSPVRIRHQYRKLKFFQWKWVDASNKVLGPTNSWVGSLWLGIIMRRRQIIYQREGGIGGFRAYSVFSQHLCNSPNDVCD